MALYRFDTRVIVPSSAVETMNLGGMMGLAALTQTRPPTTTTETEVK